MREQDVPQDPSFYKNIRRVCYAVDADNRYVLAKSAGWEVERVVTEQALRAQEEEVEAVRQKVVAGALSALAYHLATHQMTPRLFARNARIACWRVRRHLKPGAFAKLPLPRLEHYARCLDLDVAELRVVPDRPTTVFFERDG